MSKGKFKFKFNRNINGNLVDLSKYCLSHEGKQIGVEYCIDNQVAKVKEKLFEGDYITLVFEKDLNSSEETLLNSIVNEHLNKNSFSAIELLQKSWGDSEQAVYEVLPTIEEDLTDIYQANAWSGFTFSEKRILSYWNIPTSGESLEVFSSDELDSFRYYVIYKYLSDEKRKNISKEDIKNVPKEYDFRLDFENVYYKKRHPFEKGRPTKKEYFARYDATGFTYDCKFAELNFQFIDEEGTDLILQKIANLSWIFNDGTVDYNNQKDIGEVYNPQIDGILRIEESELKRRNIFDSLKAKTIGMIAATSGVTLEQAIALGVDFIEDYKTEFDNWIELGSDRQDELVTVINNDSTHTWLDNVIDGQGTTIRMYLISEVQIK